MSSKADLLIKEPIMLDASSPIIAVAAMIERVTSATALERQRCADIIRANVRGALRTRLLYSIENP